MAIPRSAPAAYRAIGRAGESILLAETMGETSPSPPEAHRGLRHRTRCPRPRHEARLSRLTILHIKVIHTVIFWLLSACVVYALFSGLVDRITTWTWVAVGLVTIESVVLAASGWTCPLTILTERLGAVRGSVADIFLPKWFADRIFPICGTTYGVALLLILFRLFR